EERLTRAPFLSRPCRLVEVRSRPERCLRDGVTDTRERQDRPHMEEDRMETTRRGNGDAGDVRRDDGMRRASPMWPSNRDMVATPFEMMRRFTDQMDRMFTSMMPGGSTG